MASPTFDLEALIQVAPIASAIWSRVLMFLRASPRVNDAESAVADAIRFCRSAGSSLLCPTGGVRLTMAQAVHQGWCGVHVLRPWPQRTVAPEVNQDR
jgi:hypothetical protein